MATYNVKLTTYNNQLIDSYVFEGGKLYETKSFLEANKVRQYWASKNPCGVYEVLKVNQEVIKKRIEFDLGQ